MKKASILSLFALSMCLADRVAACDYGQAQQIIVPQVQYQQVQRVIVPQYQQRVQVQRVIVQQQHYAAQQVQRVIVQQPRLSLNLRVR